MLEMRDKEGRLMDGDQYLEECLAGSEPEKMFLRELFE